jgi:threonine dehydratase
LTSAYTLHQPVEVDSRRTIADGIAVRRVGERCLPLCEQWLDDVITVDEESIAEAVLLLLEREKTVAEGAGAAALAGMLSGSLPVRGKHVAVLVSGGNIDVNLISRVIDRGLWRTGRLVRLRCTVNDVPGALSRLLAVVADKQANVLDIEHERLGEGLELGQTALDLLLESRGFAHVDEIEDALRQAGVATERAHGFGELGTTRRSQRVPSHP